MTLKDNNTIDCAYVPKYLTAHVAQLVLLDQKDVQNTITIRKHFHPCSRHHQLSCDKTSQSLLCIGLTTA